MTGRRLEARAIALETPTAEDPLAALDELGNLEDEDLTYHRTLTRDPKAAHAPAAKATAAPTIPAAKPVAKPPVSASKPAHAIMSLPDDADDVKLPAPPAVAPVSNAKPAAPKPLIADKSDKDHQDHSDAAHFTLQLSAFSAKHDADDLVHRAQVAGYKAFVVTSDVPGKGMIYRVRLGDYTNKDVALAEKTAVESKLRVTAFLAKR
jgi:cell division septation protein DedD